MENEIDEQVLEGEEATLQGEGNGAETEETTAQFTGLTEAQIRAIIREESQLTSKQQAEETARAFRALQSMSDKKAAQVRNDAEKQVEAMMATGAQITPDMRENYVNMLVNKYKASLADEAPEPAQAQTHQAEEPDPMLGSAKVTVDYMATKHGVSIDDADNKEFGRLWQNVNSPKAYQEFLSKADAYLETKAKTVKTPPQARMASVAGNSGSSKPTTESYKKEMQSARGNKEKVLAVQDKYRKAGIDIGSVKLYD